MNSTIDYNTLLKHAVAAAIYAGKEILAVYNDVYDIELKADKSPLTIADKNAHAKIVEMLSATELPVLSEEGKAISYDERKGRARYWLVDPLDGTKEFIKKNGEFTVNIALIENSLPVMGVIYVPVTDTLYFGGTWLPGCVKYHASEELFSENNLNSYFDNLIGSSLKLPLQHPDRPYTVVASRSHLSDETELFVSSLKEKNGDLAFISKGSSLKLCLVAEGSADCYPRLAPTMEWDTAAGHAIAESAGCRVYDFHTGNTVTYNKENLLNPYFVVMRS